MSNKLKLGVSLVIAALALIVILDHSHKNVLGGAINCNSQTCYTSLGVSGTAEVDGGFQVGANGTSVSRLNAGTCYLRPYAATIAATSTAKVDCQATAGWDPAGVSALTGVTAGDSCTLSLATSTAGTTSGGVLSAGASASTTSGFIQVNVSNLTGTTFTWPTTGTASGTASYLCTR